MAKITKEYIVERFYEIFAQYPEPEQRGVIRGLETLRRMNKPKAAAGLEQMELPEVNGEGEAHA